MARSRNGGEDVNGIGIGLFPLLVLFIVWLVSAGGESAPTIAAALGVSRATIYRVLNEQHS
jgi:hypothetical protein